MHLAANSNSLMTFALRDKYCILTRLYPAKNILALTQTHNSKSWCHKFIKLSAEFCYKLVQNNWTNTLYINNSLIHKVVPVSTFHHAKFCLSIGKEFSHRLCQESNSVPSRWSEFTMKSTWSQQISLHVETIWVPCLQYKYPCELFCTRSKQDWNFSLL